LAEEKTKKIPERGSIYFYRGCLSRNRYPGIEVSTKKILKRLGFNVYVSQDEACCGGFAYFTGFMSFKTFSALIGWNFSIAKKYANTLVTTCNGCYCSFYHVLKNIHNASEKIEVEKVLSEVGLKPAWDINVFHIAEVFYKAKEKILSLQKLKLNGLKVACHYGCHYLKAFPEDVVGNPENPTFLDEIVEFLGGKAVDYEEKHVCCGADFYQLEYAPQVALKTAKTKIESLKDADADLILVMCPLCLQAFDESQRKLWNNLGIPVLHVSEFIGLVLGFNPKKDLGLRAHLTHVHLPTIGIYWGDRSG